MKYYSKDYTNPVVDDRTEFLIEQYMSGKKDRFRILQLERYRKYSLKLFPVYAFAIILALYIGIYEFQQQEWTILVSYVLIALTYGVMAVGYYHEYK